MGNKQGRSKSSDSEVQRARASDENKEERSSIGEAPAGQKVYQVDDKQKAEMTYGKRRKSKDMDSLMKEAREVCLYAALSFCYLISTFY